MISFYAGAEPYNEVLRYVRKEKPKIPVTRLFCIQEYKFMGGVDCMDRPLSHLSTWIQKQKMVPLYFFFNF